jgi:hypothetical protein
MSEIIGGGVGGFVGGLIGSQLGQVVFPQLITLEGYDFLGSGFLDVGTEPVQLIGLSNTKAVMIRSPSVNNFTAWIGDRTVRPYNGFPLYAGDTLMLGIRNPQEVYIVTENGTQRYYLIYIGVRR